MKTVLIVEDEVGKRMALIHQLSTLGSLEEACNAREARDVLARLRKENRSLDLAVIDLMLPVDRAIGHDTGFTVIDNIRELFPKTPIIILTVRNDRAAWTKAKAKAVAYFFTKPWASKELIAAAQKCVNQELPEHPVLLGLIEDK